VIFWPLLVGEIFSLRRPRRRATASTSTVAQRFCVQGVSQAVMDAFRGA
jgi:hypothetical protein